MRFRTLLSAAALLSAGLFLSNAASATILTPGSTNVAASAIAYSTANPIASVSGNFSTATFTGSYSEFVFKDSLNTLCASVGNCLTFAIQVKNISGDVFEKITTGPFPINGLVNAFTYNVGYSAFAGGIIPMSLSESASGAIGWNFDGTSFAAGKTSDFLVVQTSATNYGTGFVSVIDNNTSTNAGFIPAAAVTPEPSSLVLLGTGLIGTATTLLRRRRIVA